MTERRDTVPGQKMLRDRFRDGRQAQGDDVRPTHAEGAKLLGVSQPAIYAWLDGTRRPGPINRAVMARVLGIPETSWLTDEERRRIGCAA